MTPEQFCYWLQGFIELQDADRRERPAGMSEEQRTMIRDHLNLVFEKVTPDRSKLLTEEKPKKKRMTMEEAIREIQKTGPGVTCDQFGPLPGDGRVC